ncbi:group I intron-associated PD-(D/E)XK endonuclease [Leifsonia sp. Leaf264]|uniref:group I intron-associated PD-(D/E)XK endonuclease n=1 Tax=Leifsonia sp. Leaf264 TaxID=1736314 RepID=UPI000A54299B
MNHNLDAIDDTTAGTAAEHLVCADLLLSGYSAFPADQTRPYDVVVDVGGRMLRVQVKSTRYAKPLPQRQAEILAYHWHPRRRSSRTNQTRPRTYGAEFDVLAVVALDSQQIAYLPASQATQTIQIRAKTSGPGKHFSDFPARNVFGVNESSGPVGDLELGTAGAHLVCADLLTAGVGASLSSPDSAFDVVAGRGQDQIRRVQVKSTRSTPGPGRPSRVPSYRFLIRRGRNRQNDYEGTYDVLALVATDIRRIAYLRPVVDRDCVSIRPPGMSGTLTFGDLTWSAATAGEPS